MALTRNNNNNKPRVGGPPGLRALAARNWRAENKQVETKPEPVTPISTDSIPEKPVSPKPTPTKRVDVATQPVGRDISHSLPNWTHTHSTLEKGWNLNLYLAETFTRLPGSTTEYRDTNTLRIAIPCRFEKPASKYKSPIHDVRIRIFRTPDDHPIDTIRVFLKHIGKPHIRNAKTRNPWPEDVVLYFEITAAQSGALPSNGEPYTFRIGMDIRREILWHGKSTFRDLGELRFGGVHVVQRMREGWTTENSILGNVSLELAQDRYGIRDGGAQERFRETLKAGPRGEAGKKYHRYFDGGEEFIALRGAVYQVPEDDAYEIGGVEIEGAETDGFEHDLVLESKVLDLEDIENRAPES